MMLKEFDDSYNYRIILQFDKYNNQKIEFLFRRNVVFLFRAFLCGSKMNLTVQFLSYTKETRVTFPSIGYTTFVKWKFPILVTCTTEAMT